MTKDDLIKALQELDVPGDTPVFGDDGAEYFTLGTPHIRTKQNDRDFPAEVWINIYC